MIARLDLIQQLEALGESAVRAKLIEGDFAPSSPHFEAVREWLAAKEAARAERRAESAIIRADIAIAIAVIAAIASIIAIWPQLSSWWRALLSSVRAS